MANVPPPYPGFNPPFNPYAGQGAAPYPQQQYPPGQQYPQGQYPPQGQPYPMNPYGAQQPPPANAGFSPYQPPPMPMPMRIPAPDVEMKGDSINIPGWTSFTDKAIRAVFVRKVYSILMLQLLFSLAVIALFVFEQNTRLFVRRHVYLYYVSYFIFLGVYIALACCGNLRRQYPTNFILLSIFTIAMSYMLGTISSMYETRVVLLAVGICAGVCLGVTLFSFHTKFDFTSCGGVLFVLVWVLFIFGIVCIFTRNELMTTVYAGAGALLFTLFLAYDTQMLMGGKKHELSPEEHIFAAMQIYLDVVYIFMMLLMLLGSGKK